MTLRVNKSTFGRLLREAYDRYSDSDMSHTAKILTAVIPTTAAWLSLHPQTFMRGNQIPIHRALPSLLAALSQSVGLVGVLDIYQELRRNLGVKVGLPKIYQVTSAVGYLLQTVGQLTITHTGVGRVFFSYNFLFMCLYAYMAYLTFAYNDRVATDSFFEGNNTTRHMVNIPALVGWVTLNILTCYVWINEGAKSLTTTYKNELLASIGLLIASIGNMRAGFSSCLNSTAEIRPFDGAMTMAAANLMAGLSLIPLAKSSPVARIYVAGYASVLYNTLVNSYYAFKEERSAKAHAQAKSKRHKAKL